MAKNSAQPAQLYEARKQVHNKRIDGPFRRFKWLVMAVTLTIYYGTPWIRWDRGPFAPDQAVLVDLANRRFADHGGHWAIPAHQRGRPGMVRLCLPANRVD